MLPQVLTDMSRMSCSAATKVPELWAKVGGGRSRVAGSGRQMGPIVPSSVGGVAWAPGLSAGGRGVAVAAGEAPWAEGAGGGVPSAVRPGVAWAPSERPSEGDGVGTGGPTSVAEGVLMEGTGSGAAARLSRAHRGRQSWRRGAGVRTAGGPP